jgi:hypothetical protein
MELPCGGPSSGEFQEWHHTRSGSAWWRDIDLVALELGHFPPQRAIFISSKRLLVELSIASLSFPLRQFSLHLHTTRKVNVCSDFSETESVGLKSSDGAV